MTLKSPRFACIDVGTNSIKLLIAERTELGIVRVFETSATTRIGEGMQPLAMRLREEPMRRSLEALTLFAEQILLYEVQTTAVVGTAALRDAENRDDFLQRVKMRCGLEIEVIPGEEEARLSYLAVRRDARWRSEPRLLVVDIGGGSTELIQGKIASEGIASRISINLGAVKLTERCFRSDPATVAQLDEANRVCAEAFDFATPVEHSDHTPFCVIGVGGTLSTLGGMSLRSSASLETLHGFTLSGDELDRLINELASRSILERMSLPGLDAKRADIILAGAIILSQALAHAGSDRLSVSSRGLRWGVLYDRFFG